MTYEARVGIDYAYESDCPAWKCPHISVHDWREGRRCPEHPCTCSEPTEPCHHCGGTTSEQCLATPSCSGPQPSEPEPT